ncbi:MAG: fatty acid desaturase [Deltaproteobacteria bacterium HGW-Deltaproteobacteria-18]|nr:MAG: fatty acid desaturase [Deltaproteobacteria bacterium HGW-Deltaproteobacteria-18]
MPPWHAAMADYRESSSLKAGWQVMNTLLPYGGLWLLMIWSVRNGYPYGLTLALGVVAAAFLVRIFILFHDCVHGSLFRSKGLNTFFGYLFGVLVFTPFEDWKFSHLKHHGNYANLDVRGFGDIWTLTRAEYEGASPTKQLSYRLYRNPLFLLGFGALFSFLLRFRLPGQQTRRKERMSVLLTNLLIVGVALLVGWTVGWRTYLLIQMPVLWLAGALGIWLFYVQHQFEGVYWARRQDWDPVRAAMDGSSFYDLPPVLRWFSGYIGYHHIHHLGPRIPNYRLKECFDALPALQAKRPLTIRESLGCVRLKLWDEEHQVLTGF